MKPKVVLAFSGGLDTCWCIPILNNQGYEVVTVTVDVGGFSNEQLSELSEISKSYGASQHFNIPAKALFFDTVLKYLVAGNVTRGGTYPLCVGAERALQAAEVSKFAKQVGAAAVAHGCTAAGNDQIRFEGAIRCVAPDITLLAPVRDLSPSRIEQVTYLLEHGFPAPKAAADYSVNSGLWGVTIGGKETTGTESSIPESQWIRTKGAFDNTLPPRAITIDFERGVPSALDGKALEPAELIEALDELGGSYGIGRGIHLGETILGIKGRVAFEAPAAQIILAAHRELEKLVLTKKQQVVKDMVAQQYGDMVHEGLALEPACRDIEALFESSQERVTGQVSLTLRTGSLFVDGVSSPFSLHRASRAVYGEAVGEWTPEDARGFGRIYGPSSVLHHRVGAK